MRESKRLMRGFVMFLLGIWLCMGNAAGISVCAQEITEVSRIMMAQREVDMKADPDESSETIHTYNEGENVFVTGEMTGWYRVRYQDLVGYVPLNDVVEVEMDVTVLDEQFAVEEEEGQMLVEEIERQRDEAKRSKIWGAVIVVLVIAIFATGIVSTMRGAKKMEEKKA